MAKMSFQALHSLSSFKLFMGSWDQHLFQLINADHSHAKLLWEIYFLNVILENYNTTTNIRMCSARAGHYAGLQCRCI